MGKLNVLPIGPDCVALGIGLSDLCSFALAELDWDRIESVVCGVEPGWDQAVAITAIDLHIPVHLVVPYLGWPEKFSTNVKKQVDYLFQESLSTTSMGSDHQERPANLYLASLADEALVLDAPGWDSDRYRVAGLKKVQFRFLWKSFKEAGYGVAV